MAGYGLTFAVFLVSAGRLGDRVGRRHAFSIGLVLFVLASASCGLAPSASALVGARLAQGLGAALISANVLSMIGVLYTGPSRVRAITVYGMVMGVAASGGVLQRGEPYQVYGTNGHPVSADEAKAIIADQFTVPEDVRQRRRASKRLQGKAPQQVVARHAKPSAERAAARRPSPEPMVTERLTPIKDVVAAIATRTGVPS